MFNILNICIIKLGFIILIVTTLHGCSAVKTETKRGDIEDVIYLPRQQAEREISKKVVILF